VYDAANKTWTLEIRRQLVTADVTDVEFDDLSREYAFGVAVFDNAQIEHSYCRPSASCLQAVRVIALVSGLAAECRAPGREPSTDLGKL
jgi:hypothetical protein